MSGTDSDSDREQLPRGEERNLFDGVEGGARGSHLSSGSLPAQPGGVAAMLRGGLLEWWRGLTYREWHAFTVGFIPWFLFLVTGHPALLGAAVGVVLACLGYRKLPNRVLRAIVQEPWYCLAGGALGWLAGAIVLAGTRLLAVLSGLVI